MSNNIISMSETTNVYEIHVSDLRTYKECRRKWNYSSPLRMNLRPEHSPVYFTVGRAVHYALAEYYETQEAPELIYDRYIDAVRLSEPIMPEDEKHITVGRGMCTNYFDWINSPEQPDEDWKVIATEIKFKTPLFNIEGKKSNRIFLAGRFDGVWKHEPTGDLWLMEFKTTSRQPNANWLTLDDQASAYCWAAQQIFGAPVKGVMFRFLMKNIPEKPNRIKKGTALSRAIKSSLHTTEALYKEAISELAYSLLMSTLSDKSDEPTDSNLRQKVAELEGEYTNILDQLAMQGYEKFFLQFKTPRTQAEIGSIGKDLWEVGLEMARDSTSLYPSPNWMKCNFCSFREPCVATNQGHRTDADLMLKHMYIQRDTSLEPENLLK